MLLLVFDHLTCYGFVSFSTLIYLIEIFSRYSCFHTFWFWSISILLFIISISWTKQLLIVLFLVISNYFIFLWHNSIFYPHMLGFENCYWSFVFPRSFLWLLSESYSFSRVWLVPILFAVYFCFVPFTTPSPYLYHLLVLLCSCAIIIKSTVYIR